MKKNKFLDTKAKWHPIPFPESYKIDDIVDFLESHKFEKLDSKEFDTLYDVLAYCYNQCSYGKYPAYIISNGYYGNKYRWIRFWTGPEIGRLNPMFFIKVTDDGSNPDTLKRSSDFGLETGSDRFINVDTFSEFIQYIQKFLKI